MAFTKVAVIGAGGNLGKHFMQSLLASSEPKFQIIVLARASSGYAPPADHVEVFKQDLTDHTMMVNSLRGADVLVLMQGMDRDFVTVSKAAIEAAIEAGVKMVIPSDYGGHHTPTQATAFPFQPQVNQFVKEKAEEGKITYTIVKNGTFFGLPLDKTFGIDCRTKRITIFGDGTQKFHTTSYGTIADALVGVLRSPAKYSNKTVFIHDFHTSQPEMLSIVESEMIPDGSKFEKTYVDVEQLGKRSLEGLAKGEYTMPNIFGAITSAVWGRERCSDWDENDDSRDLVLVKKDLRTEMKKKMEMELEVLADFN